LAVARGLPYAAADEIMKRAFVRFASLAHPGLPEHRKVSRISTTTGINRREVTRLMQRVQSGAAPPARSLASEVFAHWSTAGAYRDEQGRPRTLPRQGAAPSFETLAQGVTRDVHPRSLLDELCRLGLAEIDPATDTVRLLRDGFVPHGDQVGMLQFLSDNVGDHLDGAVDNLLRGDRSHFEQALFADGLTDASLAELRPSIAQLWQTVLTMMVPLMEQRVAADNDREGAAGRIRLGLYAYQVGATSGDGKAKADGPKSGAPRRTTRSRKRSSA
jgi:hypothetical protein